MTFSRPIEYNKRQGATDKGAKDIPKNVVQVIIIFAQYLRS